MNTSDVLGFGFGQGLDVGGVASRVGGGNALPRQVSGKDQLRTALTALTPTSLPTVIEIEGSNDPDAYDFGSGGGSAAQAIQINAKNLTLKADGLPTLKNVRLILNMDVCESIVISGLVFRSAGADDGARDAIDIVTTSGHESEDRSVWITHCSFDGYFDIAIDFATTAAGPKVLATIDHCLFYDARPGQNGRGGASFVNRGAINLGTDDALVGRAFVTVANNVYVDVWRRSPRIARACIGHVFNNLLYRWGFGVPLTGNGTWRGMEVGGGGPLTGNVNLNGTALIQANRFIPWRKKEGDDRELDIHRNTRIDLTGNPPLPNRFDDHTGTELAASPITIPAGREASFNVERFYTDVKSALIAPVVTAANNVVWNDVLAQAGPGNFATRPSNAADPRHKLYGVLNP